MLRRLLLSTRTPRPGQRITVLVEGDTRGEAFRVSLACFVSPPHPPVFKECLECQVIDDRFYRSGESFYITAPRLEEATQPMIFQLDVLSRSGARLISTTMIVERNSDQESSVEEEAPKWLESDELDGETGD